MNKILLILAFCLPVSTIQAKTFTWQTITKHIKKHELMQLFPTTLYSGCLINIDWTVNFESCNFYFRYVVKNTIDIEHIVTAERMRQHTGCGKLSRTKCRKVNERFKRCHNDRDNLFPAISTVNRYRGNLPFKELDNNLVIYPFGRDMGFKKSIDGKSVEPPERNKRLIGKTYLIMNAKDCIRLTEEEKITFSIWSLD